MCHYTRSLPPQAPNQPLHRLIKCQTQLDHRRAEPETSRSLTFSGDRPLARRRVSNYATALNGLSRSSLGRALPADVVADAVGTGGGGRHSNLRSVL